MVIVSFEAVVTGGCKPEPQKFPSADRQDFFRWVRLGVGVVGLENRRVVWPDSKRGSVSKLMKDKLVCDAAELVASRRQAITSVRHTEPGEAATA